MLNFRDASIGRSIVQIQDGLQSILQRALNSKIIGDGVFYTSLIVLTYFLLAPIWKIYYLPLGDLADHAAQMHVILNYDQYQDDYYVN